MSPKYGDFLKRLIALVTAAPTIWPLIQAWFEATKNLYDAIGNLVGVASPQGIPTPTGGLEMVTFSDEDAALEGELAQLVSPAGSQAVINPGVLRAGWFVMRHLPEIRAALDALFKLAGK